MPDSTTQSEAQALAVIIDCGVAWSRRPRSECAALVEQLLLFLNAYHMLSANNLLLILTTAPTGVQRVWPLSDDEPATASTPQLLRSAVSSGMLESFASNADVSPNVGSEGGAAAAAAAATGADPPPLLSCALAAALCRLQRVRRLRPNVEPRILLVHASADAPAQHLPAMNSVFGAQKLGVLIDAVLLGGAEDGESMLLQHAAHLTGGFYLHPDATARRALAQYLITCCLPDRYERQFLRPPPQGQPETRALCFLSKRPLDMGHACSVCLTVFEHDNLPSCPVCCTRFALAAPPGGAGRKKLRRPAAAASAASSVPVSAT